MNENAPSREVRGETPYTMDGDPGSWRCAREDSLIRVIRRTSGRVLGRVVTFHGDPVRGLLVELVAKRCVEPIGHVVVGRQESNSDGEFSFSIPNGVEFGVWIYPLPEREQHFEWIDEFPVRTAGAELLVTVRPGATIRGQIVTSEGCPDSEFDISLIPMSGPDVESESGAPCFGIRSTGTFEQSGMRTGLYMIEAKGRTRAGSRWRRWVNAVVRPRTVRLRCGVRNLKLRVEPLYPPEGPKD